MPDTGNNVNLLTKQMQSYVEVTEGVEYWKRVTLPVYDMSAAGLLAGEKTAVSNSYVAGTNRIDLGNVATKIIITSDSDVYAVLDSADAATDLADTSKRIFILANKQWERVFTDGVQVFDFLKELAGTAKVRIEAYA